MDLQPFAMCRSNIGWQHEIKSSDGKQSYLVTYDRMPPSADYEYGFSCDCQAFKFGKGKECKHIKLAKEWFCGWHQQHDGGSPINGKCPECNGEITGVMCAV
jgi:hypothetical protein